MATITPAVPLRQATPIPASQYAPLQQARALTPEEAAEFEAGGGKFVDPTNQDDGRWIIVTLASSHVNRFRYDGPTKRLYVEFQPDPKTGHKAMGYYSNVDHETYVQMREAVSFGSFVWHQLRNRFSWTRLNYSVRGKKN